MGRLQAMGRRAGTALLATAVTVGAVGSLGVDAASAAPAPLAPRPATAVTADALPTVQVDGVVWSTAVVGTTVYAGGNFTNARPAGAAAGTNLIPRTHLLAFDITTGQLVSSFAPQLNGQVLAVAASPDGTRIYVTGDFTTADGQARKRLAAYDTATGQLVASFAPLGPTAQGRAVAATNDTVYVGGGFAGSGSTPRGNLLAVRASDGALLSWNPNADYTVSALALSDDGAAVFAGGSFQNVGGSPAYGLAKISATTGALLPWNATVEVRNAGPDAGITSLRVSAGVVYGTTYHFGPGGNLEGPFAVSAATGELVWAADCHGDTYGTALAGDSLYVVGHAHYCGNVGGGFPQPATWNFQRAMAFTTAATGTNLHEPLGYPKDWFGKPSPSIVHWLPTLTPGTFTGQSQGAWTATANGDFVVLGGEFPKVNGVGQQGLVRFGRPALAPKAQGPILEGGTWVPTVVPTSTTSARVSWKSAYDRDDQALSYKVIRNDKWSTPVYSGSTDSNWWNLPANGFSDTGLTPGASYKYQIIASDPTGNTRYSSSTTITMPTTFSQTPHTSAVLADSPTVFWPLAGTAVAAGGVTDGVAGTGVTFNEPGMDTATGVRLDGTANGRISANGTSLAPTTFSTQAWIKTSTTTGGRIVGFGDLPTGNSGHRDRNVYMLNDGRLAFGVWAASGMTSITSAKAYNDNQWHQVTATFGTGGMALYVDGVRVATRADITSTDPYLGYWRVGGDNLNGWPSKPSSNDFNGAVDDVAIYPTALTQQQIDTQWKATGRTSLLPGAPADAYGAAVFADQPSLQWRLGEAAGPVAADTSTSLNAGTYRGTGFTYGQAGAIAGTANTAVRSAGTNGTFISSNAATAAPQVYSVETWFKSTSTSGGKLIGFGNSQTANSSSYDRHVYLQNDGKLVFGVANNGQHRITTAKAYNDGQWHHVVGTQSAAGLVLYVDGQPVGTNPQATASNYTGYWRVGGDSTWGSTSRFLNGTIDEAAVYPTALSAARIAEHYTLGGGVIANQLPTASFSGSSTFLTAGFDASASSDADGTITGYVWTFGDGTTGTGVNPAHAYTAAGTYTVTLTVTDNAGTVATTSKPVTVVANTAPMAAFSAADEWLAVTVDGSASSDPDGTITSWAWTFGDGGVASGATASHTYGTAGTYAVTLTVTDDAGATGVITHDVTVAAEPPNQLPTAAFSADSEWLEASFDASASADADGTITGYAWDFGDGNGGSGATPSHPYAAPGTYTVTLTVTDDDGATGVVSHDVTVQAEPPNQAPTAAFDADIDVLDVTFDGSASADADGSITGYAWDFGDDTTGSGATPSHAYSAAGTYTVTLTVTDDDGATASVSHDVVVEPQQVFAQDSMERSVTGGLGAADVGGTWTNSNPAANFSVGGGRGSIVVSAAGGAASAYLSSVSAADVDASIDVAYDKAPTGGGFYTSLVTRRIGTSDYRVKVRVTPTATQLHLARTVNGTETILSSATVPGTYEVGEVLHVRLRATGTGTTTLTAMAWYGGTAQPTTWMVTATDATAALQSPGAVGVYSYVSGSATNMPLVTSIDDLWVGAAQ